MWPFSQSAQEIELLQSVIDEMTRGNYDGAVPTLSGKLVPLSVSLKHLKSTYASTFIALEKQREELTAIINALPNALIFVAEGRVSLFNDAAREMFGLRPTDKGKLLDELELPQSLFDAIHEFLSGSERRLDTRTTPNALMQTFQVSITRLENQATGQPSLHDANFVASFTDISQRAKTDALRRDFVAAASHELKTPVAGMSLMSETAQMALKDGDTATANAMLAQIHTEAQNLQALVLDLLDLARYEDIAPADERTDLIKTSKTTVATRRQRAQDKDIALVEEYHGLGLQEVFVPLHEADVVIILDNLLDNALAYTDAGTVRIDVEADAIKHTALIRVSDTGIGIEEKDFDRIFERFYRIDKSRSRVSGGTGLGLSLVKHAVEKAGGSIVVASQKGQGTTFNVSLPII